MSGASLPLNSILLGSFILVCQDSISKTPLTIPSTTHSAYLYFSALFLSKIQADLVAL